MGFSGIGKIDFLSKLGFCGMHTQLTLLTALFLTGPFVAYAQGATELVRNIRGELGMFVAVGIGFAMTVFILGMIGFLAASGDQQAHEKGRKRMVWGIVGLFFMVSVWGIVNVIQTMLGTSWESGCTPTEIDIVRTSGSIINECL